MKISKGQLKDSARFSNFAQRVKLVYWNKLADGYRVVPEIYLDAILLICWEDFKKNG